MPLYRSTGHLTDSVNDIPKAQAYLTSDDMTPYVSANAKLEGILEHIEWKLEGDGYNYSVTAFTTRELTDDELKRLASEVSGQNSDGLGESFEQQDFAWNDEGEDDEEDCLDCSGLGTVEGDDGEDDDCPNCGGAGYFQHDNDGHMCSFDWKTNDSTFVRIK